MKASDFPYCHSELLPCHSERSEESPSSFPRRRESILKRALSTLLKCFLAANIVLLTACGQSGPLYLPKNYGKQPLPTTNTPTVTAQNPQDDVTATQNDPNLPNPVATNPNTYLIPLPQQQNHLRA